MTEKLPSIQSVSNSMVKHAYSLKTPRGLKDKADFLCEGYHLVGEALESGLHARFLFATPEGLSNPEGARLIEKAQRQKVRCFEIPSKILMYLSDTVTPQGLVAVMQKIEPQWPQEGASPILVCHQVQDAGNLGTIFRSAEAFGARALFLTEGTCDPFNPKVVRSAMGSLFRLPFMVSKKWEEYLEWLDQRTFRSYLLTQGAKTSISTEGFQKPCALWVGSEGAGLPQELIDQGLPQVGIPMTGKVESLNVGVAASLALFWVKEHLN